MKYKKRIQHFLVLSVMVLVLVGVDLQAKSFIYYTEKAKSGAESAWKSTKSGFSKVGDQFTAAQKKASATWNSIDPTTKKQIQAALISAGVVVGTAAIGAGVSYALSDSGVEVGGDRGDSASYQLTHDKGTFDQLVGFLRNDSNYAGNLENQAGFLDRFPGLTNEERLNILDIVNDPRSD